VILISEAVADFIIGLSVALVLAVVNATVIHYITTSLKLEKTGFDNPSSIAIIISILYMFLAYMDRLNLIFFILTNTVIPFVLIKEFYNIDWKEAGVVWGLWVAAMIVITAVLAFFIVIIF
jgi:hypothetical protein